MGLLASYFQALLCLPLCCYIQGTLDWEFSCPILNARHTPQREAVQLNYKACLGCCFICDVPAVLPQDISEYQSHPKLYLHTDLGILQDSWEPYAPSAAKGWCLNTPESSFSSLGTFVLLKARDKNTIWGLWRQVAKSKWASPHLLYPRGVLGSFAMLWWSGSKAGGRGSERRKWCYRNSGKRRKSQGRQGISLILPRFHLTPGCHPTELHNQFMPPAAELGGFYFWSSCCWAMATSREENLPSCSSRDVQADPGIHGLIPNTNMEGWLCKEVTAAWEMPEQRQVWKTSASETSAENAWN